MIKFNVINWDFNSNSLEFYDIIPYLIRVYKESENKPKTFEEFKEFIKKESMYQWWSRCEYEIIVSQWPPDRDTFDYAIEIPVPSIDHVDTQRAFLVPKKKFYTNGNRKKVLDNAKKVDVYQQVMMNIDVITNLLIQAANEL